MSKFIKSLTIDFDTEINDSEIPLFRGAILKTIGEQANLLYHNHTGSTSLRYSYPLIQYKRLGNNAAIIGIEEGADAIGQFLSESVGSLQIGQRVLNCHTNRITPARILVQTWSQPFYYHISRWLPLNTKNYHNYKAIDEENERTMFLENILKGNLLSMLKGLGIHIESELVLRITQLSKPYCLHNKGIGLMAFNADFTCNLSIPNHVGIGKNASIGYGIIYKQKKRDKDKQISTTE